MRKVFLLVCAFAVSFPAGLHARKPREARPSQGQSIESLKNVPVEITSTGETTYDGGIAIARDNVAIHLGDTDIYADYAEYDAGKRQVRARGNVRIYRGVNLYIAEEGVYHLDTKEITTSKMRTDYPPYFVSGSRLSSLSETAYLVENATFTTSDSTKRDFHLRAKTVRVYQNDRAVFQNVTFYVGDVPIFWWPYLYQSLNDAFSFTIAPTYLSSWGPSLLTSVTFSMTEQIRAKVRLDYRVRRGPAIGFETDIDYGKNNKSWAKLTTYYIQDQDPLVNRTSLPRGSVPTGRYRLTLENRTELTDEIYAIADLNKLSDQFLLQDFYPTEFRYDPKPDNVVAITKTNPFYTLTAQTRFQANAFFEQTERLPEVVLDIKRHALFGGPIFYEGETGVARLQRDFAANSGFEDYGAFRADSFHQLLYPNTYFGWLSIVPRAGFRATYYSESRDIEASIFHPNPNPFIPDFFLPNPTLTHPLEEGGERLRLVYNTGAEASFKISRTWEEVQSRAVGLDGLRHVVQPFTNFSYVYGTNTNPAEILQFDRYQPSTQLQPVDFPQFTSVDSIDRWTIWRAGVRNRLQTRRDDATVSWLELETYLDLNVDNPFDKTDYSNLFNKLRYSPLPWTTFSVASQVPALDNGFTEVNTQVSVQPFAPLQVSVGHRYLNDNPFFDNSSLVVLGGYYRLNNNWGVAVQEQYETSTGVLEQQRYAIYRDLTSWVASIGAVIQDNAGVKEYGVQLTFTLKAFPRLGLNVDFDPAGLGETGE